MIKTVTLPIAAQNASLFSITNPLTPILLLEHAKGIIKNNICLIYKAF